MMWDSGPSHAHDDRAARQVVVGDVFLAVCRAPVYDIRNIRGTIHTVAILFVGLVVALEEHFTLPEADLIANPKPSTNLCRRWRGSVVHTGSTCEHVGILHL